MSKIDRFSDFRMQAFEKKQKLTDTYTFILSPLSPTMCENHINLNIS